MTYHQCPYIYGPSEEWVVPTTYIGYLESTPAISVYLEWFIEIGFSTMPVDHTTNQSLFLAKTRFIISILSPEN
jgi:hypothetical protein